MAIPCLTNKKWLIARSEIGDGLAFPFYLSESNHRKTLHYFLEKKQLAGVLGERAARANMAEKLTPEQADECKEIFDLFDADEDGKDAALASRAPSSLCRHAQKN